MQDIEIGLGEKGIKQDFINFYKVLATAIDKSRKGEKSDVVGAFLGMQDAQKEKIESILKGYKNS